MKKRLTATEIVEGIKSGNISCEELVWAVYERIERSELNAFITLNKEDAVEKAREADKRKNEEEYRRKKLLGVPIAIKDSISTREIQTTCASKILKEERRKSYIPRCGIAYLYINSFC